MLITGKISLVRALLYIIFQCAGATAGTASIQVLLHENYQNTLGHTDLAEHVTPMQGLGFEFFLGFILIFTVFGVCDGNKPGNIFPSSFLSWQISKACNYSTSSSQHTDSKYIAPLAIGLAVTVGHLGTIKYTGSSMNPARTFGTAVCTSKWDNHWVKAFHCKFLQKSN